MVYIIANFLAFLLTLLFSFVDKLEKSVQIPFFLLFEINFIFYYRKFFLLNIFLLYLLIIFFYSLIIIFLILTKISSSYAAFLSIIFDFINNYLFYSVIIINFILEITNDIICNMQNQNIVHCGGVPKLVYLAELETGFNLNCYKTLFKYNFSLLGRKNTFYTDRSTIIELKNICSELNLLYNSNIDKLLAMSTLKDKPDNTELIANLENFYSKNIFLKQNLRLVNQKLGIPLYVDLCNKTFYPSYLIYLLKKNFNVDIIRNIHTFLIHEKLSENVNYFNLDLRINSLGNLIVLQQDFTVDATTDIDEKITNRVGRNREIIRKDTVISTVVLDNGQIANVTDTFILPEAPNGDEIPAVIKSRVGIIETYLHYFKCMDKTVSLLNFTNSKLENLTLLLSEPNFKEKIVKDITLTKFDFDEFYEPRVIAETVIPDSRELFQKDGIILSQSTKERFNKIDSVFLKQLKKDSTMLRDIYNQQSNMYVKYPKLIQIMENPDKDIQHYFNQNIKNKILQASKNNFSLKRSRHF